MPQVKVNIDDAEYQTIQRVAKDKGTSPSVIITKLVREGLSLKELPQPLSEKNPLLKYIGCIKDAPQDLAENLDTYLYK